MKNNTNKLALLEKEVKSLKNLVYSQSAKIDKLTSLIESMLTTTSSEVRTPAQQEAPVEKPSKPIREKISICDPDKKTPKSSAKNEQSCKDRSRFYYNLRKTKAKSQTSLIVEVPDNLVVKKTGAVLHTASSDSKNTSFLSKESKYISVFKESKSAKEDNTDLLIFNQSAICKPPTVYSYDTLYNCVLCKKSVKRSECDCSKRYCLHHCKGLPHVKSEGCWPRSNP